MRWQSAWYCTPLTHRRRTHSLYDYRSPLRLLLLLLPPPPPLLLRVLLIFHPTFLKLAGLAVTYLMIFSTTGQPLQLQWPMM